MRRVLLTTTAIASVAAMLAMGVGAAEANTIPMATYTSSVSGVDWSTTSINIAMFDSSLGTLDSVVITETLSGNYNLTVAQSQSGSLTSVTAHLETMLSITGGPSILDGSPVLALGLMASQLVNVDASAGPASASYTAIDGGSGTVNATLTHPVDDLAMAAWQTPGGGNTTITLNSTSDSPDGPPFQSVTVAPFLDYVLQVTYNYTPTVIDGGGGGSTDTPEPASLLLMSGGLLALATARQRRKARRPESND